jgi:hypothetical protein
VKHGLAKWNTEQVNITSNISWREWHTDRRSDIDALERRIDEIMTFTVTGYRLTVQTQSFDVESYGHTMTNETFDAYDVRDLPWIPRRRTSNTQPEQDNTGEANTEPSQSLDRVSPIQPTSASTSDEEEDQTTPGRAFIQSTSTSTSQEEDSEG